ncbi:MAG: hypothetical protein AB4426_25600 [Xenococcaceae cyanobacterium]
MIQTDNLNKPALIQPEFESVSQERPTEANTLNARSGKASVIDGKNIEGAL